MSERRPSETDDEAADEGYKALEADAAGDFDEARAEAEALDDVTADFPLDDDVESASPDEVEVPTLSGEDIETTISERPETERVPPEEHRSADRPCAR